jgi:tetratricopeptide (TPR) repeat protein
MSSALAEAFCEKRVVIGAKISLLKVLIETGQSKKARKVGEELLKDEEGCGWQKNDPERLRLLNNLGPVYSSLHLYDKAFKTLEECKELAEERRDDLQVARVLNNLGPVYVEQGKWEEAKDVLERCLKITQIISKNKIQTYRSVYKTLELQIGQRKQKTWKTGSKK